MYDNQLQHFGVKGMKWGVRRSNITGNTAGRRSPAEKAEKKQAKAERKSKIKSTYKTLNKKASLGEKLTFNNATRKKAAKYIVDNNMTVEQATLKSQGDAYRNTAIFVAAYGAISVAGYIANKNS
ncbi:MAG: hypothetical protein K9L62_02185 [Vallitaleaceae bacterium]|nr:hypothetical protein [Vallitaleaceae bacterium]